MDDKTTQNTFLKMKQRHTIETAASLIVLDDVVQEEKWRNNAGIQEAYKVLRDKTLKAFRYSKLKISVYEAIELLENNPYLAEAIRKYPDLTRKDLVTAVERYFERELAVSRIAPGDIIKGENWHNVFEVQIQKPPVKEMLSNTCKSLFEDICKACRKSESIIKKDKIIELIKNNFLVNTTIQRYPDIKHHHFATMIERFFEKALSECTRTFNEISKGLNNEYSLAKSCCGIMDFERDIEYTSEYIKIAMEVYLVIEALIKDADKFYLDPRFYLEGESETDYSCFCPVSLNQAALKGYFEVRTDGIVKLLEYYKIPSKFFNTIPEKQEMEITDTPKSSFPSADDLENRLMELDNNNEDKYQEYTDRLTPVEYKTFEAYKKGASVEAIAEHEKVSETAIYKRINKARRKTGDYTDYRKRK